MWYCGIKPGERRLFWANEAEADRAGYGAIVGPFRTKREGELYARLGPDYLTQCSHSDFLQVVRGYQK